MKGTDTPGAPISPLTLLDATTPLEIFSAPGVAVRHIVTHTVVAMRCDADRAELGPDAIIDTTALSPREAAQPSRRG